MIIRSEQEMLDFGKSFAESITSTGDAVIELIGDVGAGKTTFVRGFAEGLGIKEPVTSPSFTISKSYALPNNKRLVHYDFYRLSDPGLMSEDLKESLDDNNTITVIEWSDSVSNLLPEHRIKIEIEYNDDNTRDVKPTFL